jgi:hypothetical protein
VKVKEIRSEEERKVLTALVLKDGVLAAVYNVLGKEKELFRSRWSNQIASWCMEYFAKHQKAPKKAILEIFQQWSSTSRDLESVELVERYLSSLDEVAREVDGLADDFLIDLASRYFKKVRIHRLQQELEVLLEREDVEAAETKITSFQRIQLSTNDWIDPFSKEFILRSLRRENEEDLIVFPKALGEFFSGQLKRGGFVAFAGPEKRGKSFWLQEIAWRALLQRRKVLYYVLGDMPETEVGERLICRAAKRPIGAGEVRIPRSFISKDPRKPRVRYESLEYTTRIDPSEAVAAMEKVLQETAAKYSRLQLKREGGGILSASDVEAHILQFCRKDWVPDVVVIDYADLLRPERGTSHMDLRHQINATWMTLRRIALEYYCLVVTATQTAATSYNSDLIRKRDFSEDKRKYAHVTGMVGINQTEQEKDWGVYRLNWIVLRKGRFSEHRVVWTAGELAVACPCIISSW